MYPYGDLLGDFEVPNTSEYSKRCFKIDIPDDGMQFFGKAHSQVYVCIHTSRHIHSHVTIKFTYLFTGVIKFVEIATTENKKKLPVSNWQIL